MQSISSSRRLRVRKPLRIWFLPDSAQASGNLLTRDDSGETSRVLPGCSASAGPGSPSVSLMVTKGRRQAALPRWLCDGADVTKASPRRGDPRRTLWLASIDLQSCSSFLQGRKETEPIRMIVQPANGCFHREYRETRQDYRQLSGL